MFLHVKLAQNFRNPFSLVRNLYSLQLSRDRLRKTNEVNCDSNLKKDHLVLGRVYIHPEGTNDIDSVGWTVRSADL